MHYFYLIHSLSELATTEIFYIQRIFVDWEQKDIDYIFLVILSPTIFKCTFGSSFKLCILNDFMFSLIFFLKL
jgi:hypothetical protein